MAEIRHRMRYLLWFGWLEALSCAYAVGVLGMLAVTRIVPLPFPRYDVLLVGCLLLTLVFRLAGLEGAREVAIIGLFHVIGLLLEVHKVAAGSWSYPEPALSKVFGVPLYSGFMYAAVGSYICHAWRRFGLVVTGYRPLLAGIAAAAGYLNFFTQHRVLPDLRWVAIAALVLALWRCRVHFRVLDRTFHLPMALSFLLIASFVWLAENIATYLGAWRYPHQANGWQPVGLDKLGSWTLLVAVAVVIVASLSHRRQPPATPAC